MSGTTTNTVYVPPRQSTVVPKENPPVKPLPSNSSDRGGNKTPSPGDTAARSGRADRADDAVAGAGSDRSKGDHSKKQGQTPPANRVQDTGRQPGAPVHATGFADDDKRQAKAAAGQKSEAGRTSNPQVAGPVGKGDSRTAEEPDKVKAGNDKHGQHSVGKPVHRGPAAPKPHGPGPLPKPVAGEGDKPRVGQPAPPKGGQQPLPKQPQSHETKPHETKPHETKPPHATAPKAPAAPHGQPGPHQDRTQEPKEPTPPRPDQTGRPEASPPRPDDQQPEPPGPDQSRPPEQRSAEPIPPRSEEAKPEPPRPDPPRPAPSSAPQAAPIGQISNELKATPAAPSPVPGTAAPAQHLSREESQGAPGSPADGDQRFVPENEKTAPPKLEVSYPPYRDAANAGVAGAPGAPAPVQVDYPKGPGDTPTPRDQSKIDGKPVEKVEGKVEGKLGEHGDDGEPVARVVDTPKLDGSEKVSKGDIHVHFRQVNGDPHKVKNREDTDGNPGSGTVRVTLTSGDATKSITYEARVTGEPEMMIPKGSPIPENADGKGTIRAQFIPDPGCGRGIQGTSEPYAAKAMTRTQDILVVRRAESHELNTSQGRGSKGTNTGGENHGSNAGVTVTVPPNLQAGTTEGGQTGQERSVDENVTNSDKTQTGNNARVDSGVIYTHRAGQAPGALSRPDLSFRSLPKPKESTCPPEKKPTPH